MKANTEAGLLGSFDEVGDIREAIKQAAQSYMWLMVGLIIAIIAIEIIVVLVIVKCFRKSGRPQSVKTLIVLGSGGHTAEMLKLVESLDKKRYTPRAYVVATTDRMSGRKAVELESSVIKSNDKAGNEAAIAEGSADGTGAEKPWELFEIPRSREVGQWYITSVWTTLIAFSHAVALLFRVAPQVVLVNGPGTCIPVCVAAFFYGCMAPMRCKIVYVESIARTRKLSLSGMILYHLRMADLLLVQWQELAERYPRTKYVGRLY